MATKKKTWYYVLVFTSEGPKYVTGEGEHHTAYWDELKEPKEMSKEYANSMVIGLLWNGYNAQVVASPIELDSQPYRYEIGHFEFIRKSQPSYEDVIAWISEHPQVFEDFKQKFGEEEE